MGTLSLPKIRKATVQIDTTKSREWLALHRSEYLDQWVVLDGDRLIGAGKDPLPFIQQARSEGVKHPFIKFIRDESEPFLGGWL